MDISGRERMVRKCDRGVGSGHLSIGIAVGGVGKVVALAEGAVVDAHAATAEGPDSIGFGVGFLLGVDDLATASGRFLGAVDDARAGEVGGAIAKEAGVVEGELLDAGGGHFADLRIGEAEELIELIGVGLHEGSYALLSGLREALFLLALHDDSETHGRVGVFHGG